MRCALRYTTPRRGAGSDATLAVPPCVACSPGSTRPAIELLYQRSRSTLTFRCACGHKQLHFTARPRNNVLRRARTLTVGRARAHATIDSGGSRLLRREHTRDPRGRRLSMPLRTSMRRCAFSSLATPRVGINCCYPSQPRPPRARSSHSAPSRCQKKSAMFRFRMESHMSFARCTSSGGFMMS
jgi:hypothetical protein